MTDYSALIEIWGTLKGEPDDKLKQIELMTVKGLPQEFSVQTDILFNLIELNEYRALQNPSLINLFLSRDSINISSGTNIRAIFDAIGEQTATNLQAAEDANIPLVPWWKANGYQSSLTIDDADAAGLLAADEVNSRWPQRMEKIQEAIKWQPLN